MIRQVAFGFLISMMSSCLYSMCTQPLDTERAMQQPSTLDYVFKDEENLIEDAKLGSPLGKSDHTVMEWDVIIYTEGE